MEISAAFSSPRHKAIIPDTFFVHISGFFDKNNNPIFLDPIVYYYEDMVEYFPFRDGGRVYVSSKNKVKIDFKSGYLIIFDNGQCRKYIYGKPKRKAKSTALCP